MAGELLFEFELWALTFLLFSFFFFPFFFKKKFPASRRSGSFRVRLQSSSEPIRSEIGNRWFARALPLRAFGKAGPSRDHGFFHFFACLAVWAVGQPSAYRNTTPQELRNGPS